MKILKDNKKYRMILLFSFFCLLISTAFISMFYRSPLHQRIDEMAFDYKTKNRPEVLTSGNVVVVTISQDAIDKYYDQHYRRVSVSFLVSLLEQLHKAEVSTIGLLLPHQDYDYHSPSLQPLVDYLVERPNIYLGIFDYHRNRPTVLTLPGRLGKIKKQVFGADSQRVFRQGVIRQNPLYSYLGSALQPQLVLALALKGADPQQLEDLRKLVGENSVPDILQGRSSLAESRVKINYFPQKQLTILEGKEVVEGREDLSGIRNKVVLVGYTAFRPRDINNRDGTFANTPWQGDEGSEKDGAPLVFIKANAIENLLAGQWLREPHWSILLFQTAVSTAVGLLLWFFPLAFAAVLIFLQWYLILFLQGVTMAYLYFDLPVSAISLFLGLSGIAGAFMRARYDGKDNAERLISARSKRRLSAIQGLFLDQFANDLCRLNRRIFCLLKEVCCNRKNILVNEDIAMRAMISSEDLNEYLQGMTYFSKVEDGQKTLLRKSKIIMTPLFNRVLAQFDSHIVAKNIVAHISCADELAIESDVTLLEAILFNIISNAVKYSKFGGNIWISAKRGSCTSIQVNVSDEGPGIAVEEQAKIFQKFYRVSNDRVYLTKGNGLGLYLCKYFADQLQVPLQLKSTVGLGTTFTFGVKEWRDSRRSWACIVDWWTGAMSSTP